MYTIIFIIIIIGIALFILARQKRFAKLQSLAQGLLISYFTLLLLFGIGEAYFRFFYAQSTAYYSLSHQNWLDRYWQVNDEGYRDPNWQTDDFEEQEVIVVIGDSFTAGSGIDDPHDRYSNVLADLLGDSYRVVNRGIPGSSTPQQLEALQSFETAKPDIVIWQYFLNDIEYAALRVSDLPPVGVPPEIARKSHLLNFLYYYVNPPLIDYWGWQYAQYDNFAIWEMHRQEIDDLIAYVEQIDAELIVVIYPNMLDPVGSIPYVDRVEQAIAENGQEQIIKLFEAVAAWPEGKPLIVSQRDAHPSVEFNHYVAEALYQQFFVSTEDASSS